MQIDYFAQSKAFRQLKKDRHLTRAARLLYPNLLQIANDLRWKDPFGAGTRLLREETLLSNDSIEKARDELAEKGFITYEKQKGRRATLYHLICLYEQPQETAEQAAARQAREAADEEQARLLMKRHPDGEEVKVAMQEIGFRALEAAQMIDEGGVSLCREIMTEVNLAKVRKSKKGLYLTKYNDRAPAIINSRQAAAQNQREAQERQEQQDASFTAPDVNAVISDIA